MNFTKIKPWGSDDKTTYWISGIYKIVKYEVHEYGAYYMHFLDKNWGRNLGGEPICKRHKHASAPSMLWPTLKAAKKACQVHSLDHEPEEHTIKRAKKIRDNYIEMDVACVV